jgi:hypothetical protein
MADGPLDYGSGYIFESQKRISDRRAARGFSPGPGEAHWSGGSTGGDVGRGGGTLGDFIIKAIVFLMVAGLIVAVVASVAAMIVGAWLFYHLVRAIWHSRR